MEVFCSRGMKAMAPGGDAAKHSSCLFDLCVALIFITPLHLSFFTLVNDNVERPCSSLSTFLPLFRTIFETPLNSRHPTFRALIEHG